MVWQEVYGQRPLFYLFALFISFFITIVFYTGGNVKYFLKKGKRFHLF
jgi:hypothetical protein